MPTYVFPAEQLAYGRQGPSGSLPVPGGPWINAISLVNAALIASAWHRSSVVHWMSSSTGKLSGFEASMFIRLQNDTSFKPQYHSDRLPLGVTRRIILTKETEIERSARFGIFRKGQFSFRRRSVLCLLQFRLGYSSCLCSGSSLPWEEAV